MKKLLVVLLLAFPTLSSAEAVTAYISGNELFSWIEKDSESWKKTISVGYIQGVADALSVQGNLCLPKTVSVDQLKAIAKNHIKNNPSKRHYAAADTVGSLFITTFPCNDSPK